MLKDRVYALLERSDPNDRLGRWVKSGIVVLILANVAALFAETHLRGSPAARRAFGAFEAVSVILFTSEYLLRLWICTCEPRYAHPIWGRLRYVVSPLALVDLLAILPFWLRALQAFDARMLRALRLFRLLRVLKLGRYSKAMGVLATVLRGRRADLATAGIIIVVLLIVASSLIYYAEHRAQPAKFPTMTSALWWGIAALSTIGYGDVVPITTLGKILGGFVSLLGIGVFGLPAGILASGFAEELRRERADDACPHCGRNIHVRAVERR